MKSKNQKGFTLLELGITTSLIALGVVAAIQMQLAKSRQDTAKAAAQSYELVNNAVGSYLTNFYDQILAKAITDPGCQNFPFTVGGPLLNPSPRAVEDCRFNLR